MNPGHIAVQRQITIGYAAGQWINLAVFSCPHKAERYFQWARAYAFVTGERTRISHRNPDDRFAP